MQLFMIHLSSKFAQKGGIKMANVKTDRKPLNATKKKQSLNKQKVTINGKTEVMTTREAKKIRKGSK